MGLHLGKKQLLHTKITTNGYHDLVIPLVVAFYFNDLIPENLDISMGSGSNPDMP